MTGAELYEARKNVLGLSQTAFGREVGVHRNTVSRWHRKQVMPKGMKTGRAFVWSKERVVKWAKEAGLI